MNWHEILTRAVLIFNDWVLFYFGVLNAFYIILFLISLYEVVRFVKRTFFSDYEQILKSEMTWPISILVPAHNESRTIVETVRSLLSVNYGQFEVIVINDGSTDDTLQKVVRTFDLKRTDRVYRRTLETSEVRGLYSSLEIPNLVVIDKVRAGKADALNAGINVSRFPLYCSVDADSIIEDNALLRVVKPFMEHPREMVAVGGIVRIANGCEIREGRVVRVELPDRPLAIFQVIEYLRAFLTGRVGWSVL
ncbi:MAG TPA: glycosyltransferase family 2 protein, partial [Candidatus Polarisedimenticolia bacterium]|nr:glycosyltransferase family 2 protein [Candidatus Polarisedimenticolia bacterium]